MDLIKVLQENITLEVLYYIFAFFVAMDILTGVVKAWKNGRMTKEEHDELISLMTVDEVIGG